MTTKRRWLNSVLQNATIPAPRLPWERPAPAPQATASALAAR